MESRGLQETGGDSFHSISTYFIAKNFILTENRASFDFRIVYYESELIL